jgi:hypothetical protein
MADVLLSVAPAYRRVQRLLAKGLARRATGAGAATRAFVESFLPRGAVLAMQHDLPDADMSVLTEDRPENRGFFSESVEVVVEMMVNPQGQINHFDDLGDDLRAASEPCEKVTNVAVVLFDRAGQVFACEELLLRDEATIALPIIGDERFAFDADFVEEFLACGVITATKNPGDGSPSNRVIGPPNPQFCSPFVT